MDTTKRAHILGSAMALLAFLNADTVAAQGLESSETIDAIVQAPVREEEQQAAADPAKVLAAIEKTTENISAVRKLTTLDRLDIVFMTDATVAEGGPPEEIGAMLVEREQDVTSLRKEIEGNALLYHAINSRQVLMRDILGLEFNDGGSNVVIYAAAKPARGGSVAGSSAPEGEAGTDSQSGDQTEAGTEAR